MCGGGLDGNGRFFLYRGEDASRFAFRAAPEVDKVLAAAAKEMTQKRKRKSARRRIACKPGPLYSV